MIGSVIASRWAADVDGEGRFPSEAMDGLCHERLLSCALPVALGGDGLEMREICTIARVLGRYCASTAMIFVVHQAMVLSILRHHRGEEMEDLLREIADDQLLVTGCGHDLMEGVTVGPDNVVSASGRAVTVLFAGQADLVVVRARRPDQGDETLAVFRADEIELRRQALGDGLGLRGLGWHTYSVSASLSEGNVLGASFREVAAETVVPVLRLLSCAAWVGIADSAIDTADRFIAAAVGDRSAEAHPASLRRLARVRQRLDEVYSSVDRSAAQFGAHSGAIRGAGQSIADSAYAVSSIVSAALDICGTAGYQDGGEFGLGRQLRDLLGAREMIRSAVGVSTVTSREEQVG
ncbi:acyl-CoA dehydrogenase [Rhodococcus sp. LBL1]|nr:acyl-CoA dehydrogenase [Rhodococcus sp. LBL1]MDH6681482.1 acyl-CoA dehydrogenase [Rhodococcus sp. LBL2]